MRVWYLGYYLDWYPRNRVIRKGLEQAGAEVINLRIAFSRAFRPARIFSKSIARLFQRKKPDVIIIPEVDLESFPFAWMIARSLGALLVYDAFYSRWDALVRDELETNESSTEARITWLLEKFALERANLIFSDTLAHCDYIAELYDISREKFETVYIGADDQMFYPMPELEVKDHFLVHYNGFYHRLQGAPAIIESAHLLRDYPEIKFEMIGKRLSSSFQAVQEKYQQLNPPNITFEDTLPIEEMPRRMARASVCLGIFGRTGFGERVFPNKGFQALALAKPLITRESKGSKEVGEAGVHYLTVPAEDGKALAEAILFLKNNPEKRKEIARAGYQLYKERYAPEPIGKKLLSRLEQELKRKKK